jgi:hypothetical protein
MVVEIFIILLLIVLGILFLNGKGAFLIAGFNTKSLEEQEVYDKKALCKFMGIMTFVLAFSMLFWVLLNLQFLFIVGIVLFFCTIIFMLIYMNMSNRFKK